MYAKYLGHYIYTEYISIRIKNKFIAKFAYKEFDFIWCIHKNENKNKKVFTEKQF